VRVHGDIAFRIGDSVGLEAQLVVFAVTGKREGGGGLGAGTGASGPAPNVHADSSRSRPFRSTLHVSSALDRTGKTPRLVSWNAIANDSGWWLHAEADPEAGTVFYSC
jgi:hypothetical protein